MAKDKGATLVFGMGGSPKASGADDEAHTEATDALKDALTDAGVDASDTLMQALHAYVEACIKTPPPETDDDEEGY